MKRGFCPVDIILPKKGIDMSKWSVIACDQFTSEPEYWEKVEELVGDNPSALRMILPEVYLDGPEEEKRLVNIRYFMEKYIEEDIFEEYKNAMIYVERTDSTGKMRAGIVGGIDLEQYDYHKGSHSLVRATEATLVERIPARIRVRRNAPMEIPHIMILIDDNKKSIVEPVAGMKDESKLLYDFDLMLGGGHIRGYLLGESEQAKILAAIDQMHLEEARKAQQVIADRKADVPSVMLFAVGDGNHSLASAKEYYEQLKAENPGKDLSNHPARYALAEIVNVHSPALEFEAIHRIVKQVDGDNLMKEMTACLGLVSIPESKGTEAIDRRDSSQEMVVVRQGRKQRVQITKPLSKLTVGSLQNFLNEYVKEHPAKVDYIHGADTVETLSMKKDSVGFLLPDMGKGELFPTVLADGSLPRKTFSMGHAEDKRYYTECRRIREI